MAKFHYPSKLSKESQEEILLALGRIFAEIKNPAEALSFLKDLLSAQEAEMLAKRVKIAELLLDGLQYDDIKKHLKVSSGTIARVNEWLKYSGDGYRLLIERMKKYRNKPAKSDELSPWTELKRKYPIMFWPQLLMEEFAKNASMREKQRLRFAIEEMDKKSEVYKRIDAVLRRHGGI